MDSLSGEGDKDALRVMSCPITLRLMRDPVLLADGHTYERAAAEEWLFQGHEESPSTGEPLSSLEVLPRTHTHTRAPHASCLSRHPAAACTHCSRAVQRDA